MPGNNNIKKTNKKEKFKIISEILKVAEDSGIILDIPDITYKDLYEFIDQQIISIENRSIADQARSIRRKDEDPLRGQIYNVLSDKYPMQIYDIIAAIGDPELTIHMVTPRLEELCGEYELVTRERMIIPRKHGKPRKVTGYRKIPIE